MFEDRIRRLERASAKWRMFACSLLMLLLICLILGQTKLDPKVIEAERIIFRDADGKVRMEIKRDQSPGKPESFGIYLTDVDGESNGALHCEGSGIVLEMTQSPVLRRATARYSLSLMEKIERKTDEEKREWEEVKKLELERIPKLGKLSATVSGRGINLLDQRLGGGSNLSTFSDLGLAAKSIVVAENPFAAFAQGADAGTITVVDGNVTVKSSKEKRSAVLGSTKLVGERTGDVTDVAISSLTLFNQDGKPIFRAP